MFLIDRLILLGAILLLMGIISSKFSARLGLPALVLFLIVGMLAGEDGIGGIEFENYPLAHGIASIALAVILFDGGLRTPFHSIRAAWKPAFLLATVGVVITAAITGLAAAWILDLPIAYGLLLGSIVGSTDAAAVFLILRSGGVYLRRRLGSTLEIESGSNDPMAILLTIAMIQVILGTQHSALGMVVFFLQQLGVGLIVGLLLGRVGAEVINRIRLESAGLYPVLATVIGLLSFGISANLGGSGFLAIYVTGIILGNSKIVFERGTLLLHDGLAWISQMIMFIMLGLLSSPRELLAVAPQGLLISLALTLVARPATVALLMLPFGWDRREVAFMAWAGIKGAVPIILATYPLMFGVPDALMLFNVLFFVVFVSAAIQGWTLRPVAEWLGVQGTVPPSPPVALEISSLRHIDGDIVDYLVTSESRAAGRRLRDLALPEGAVVALMTRGDKIIPPRGSTTILAGDHVFVVLRPETRAFVDYVFRGRNLKDEGLVLHGEFPLEGTATVADLREFYGIELDAPDDATLGRLVRERLGRAPDVNDEVQVGPVVLRVHEMINDHIAWVALSVAQDEADLGSGDGSGIEQPTAEASIERSNPDGSG